MKILSRLNILAEDEWFDSLTTEQKKAYIEEHPDSKYAKKSGINQKNPDKNKSNTYELKILVDRDRDNPGDVKTESFQAPSNLEAILYVAKKYDLEWVSFNELDEETISEFKSGERDAREILETEDPSDYYDNVIYLINKTTNSTIFEDLYFDSYEEEYDTDDDEDWED